MAARRRGSQIRLTPLGYFVIGLILVIAIVGIYFAIWSSRDAQQGAVTGDGSVVQAPETTNSVVNTITMTPSLAPIATPTQDITVTDTPVPLTAEPSGTPTSNSTNIPEAVKTPTSSEKKNAVSGKLTTDGVVLRKGPSRSYAVIKEYNSGTALTVYAAEEDYYYVQIDAEKIYGYMAVKFIEKDGLLPGETATPTPKAPDGAVNGTVSASVVALRKMPTTEGNDPIGEATRGDAVYIYFETDGFYYIEVVKTGVRCYAKAGFITASGSVPSGTPVP